MGTFPERLSLPIPWARRAEWKPSALTYQNSLGLRLMTLVTLYCHYRLPSVFPTRVAETKSCTSSHHLTPVECLPYSNHSLGIISWTKEYLELLKLPISQNWKTELKSLFRKQWQSRLKSQLPLTRAHGSGCGPEARSMSCWYVNP